MQFSKLPILIFTSLIITFLFSCSAEKNQSDNSTSQLDKILGKEVPKTAAGEYLEFTIGGDAGSAIAKNMEKQAKHLRKLLVGAEVNRIGEGLLITFDSTNSFAINSSEVNEKLKKNIGAIAIVADDFEDTDIIIEGHTDMNGSDTSNLAISEKRAQAVGETAVKAGIDKFRLTTIGYGNKTPKIGKKQKLKLQRRVEIVIVANKKMVTLAKRGDL